MAATLWLGWGSAISHTTAGSWLHLDGIRTDELHVSVSATNRRRSNNADLTIHRVVSLPPHDVRIIDGVSCTTAARTLFDIAVSLDDEALETAIRVCTSARPHDRRRVAARAARARSATRRGYFGAVLSALERRPLESRLEIKLARLLERARFRHRSPSFGSVRIALIARGPSIALRSRPTASNITGKGSNGSTTAGGLPRSKPCSGGSCT